MANALQWIDSDRINLRAAAIPSVIGKLVSTTHPMPDGRGTYQLADHGAIFYSDQYGSVAVSKAILAKWQSDSVAKAKTAGGESVQAYLGLPMHDSVALGGGIEACYFERGMIVTRPNGGFVVYGRIYLHYRVLNDVHGTIGRPTSDELPAANGGRVSHFDNCDIYWSGGSDAFEVHGAIRDKYMALGGPGGFLGYPLSDETVITHAGHEIGRFNLFTGGSIYWSPATGAWEIHGDLRDVWQTRHGGPAGPLGFPTSDELATPSKNARYNNFQNGILVWRGAKDQTYKITKLDLYIDRFESRGKDTVLGNKQDLYVKASAHASTGPSFSKRFPDKGDMGESRALHQVVFSIPVRRGDIAVDITFEGWDHDTIGKDDKLGVAQSHHTIDNLWEVTPAAVEWHHDFRVVYTLKPDIAVDQSKVRDQLWWKFRNFNTPTFSQDQFAQTFSDVAQDESWFFHPFNKLFYELAYKKIGAKGNCFGMCLESIYARMNHSVSNEPIHLYDKDAIRTNEINVKHGYQLGGGEIDYFVGAFIAGATRDPARVFIESRAAYARGDFPIISVSNDGVYSKGHALMPYAWNDSDPNRWVISIANPNNPSPGTPDTAPGNFIEIISPKTDHARFNYQHGSSELWSGTKSSGGRMLSIPFHLMCHQPRTPFWEAILALTAASIIILGDGGSTDAVSDDRPGGVTALPHGALHVPATATAAASAATMLAQLHAAEIKGLTRLPFHNMAGAAATPHMVHVQPGALHIDPSLAAHLSAAPEVYRLDHGAFGQSGAKSLDHRIRSAGRYSWGVRSAAASAVARVEGSKGSDTISLKRANERVNPTFAFTAGADGSARRVSLDFASTGDHRNKARKELHLKGLDVAVKQGLTARLEAGGEELVVQAGEQPLTFDLAAKASSGAALEKAGLTIAPGQALRLRPLEWTPGKLHAAPLEVQTLEKIGGAVLSKRQM